MAYEKQTFVNGETVLTAEMLEHIEDGIAGVAAMVIDGGVNMVNIDDAVPGYYISESTGAATANAKHTMIQWVPVKPNTQYILGLTNGSNYGNFVINSGVRIALFDANKTRLSSYICDTAGENVFTTTSDAAYLCFSWNSATYTLYPMLAEGDTLPEYSAYQPTIINPKYVDGYTRDEADELFAAKEATEEVKLPYTSVSGDMTDGTILAIAENNVQKKNLEFVFVADITTMSEVTVGMRHAYSGTLWNRITVDSTNVKVHGKDSEVATYEHGLTIANNIQVHIHINYNLTADLTLVSNGNRFEQNIGWADYTQIVQPFAQSSGSVLTDCVFTVLFGDIEKPIWAFGDSYFNYSVSRWMYYANEAGCTKNMMLDAHPGEGSTSGVYALQTALLHGKPKFVLWCMGMNDTTDGDTLNDDWIGKLETVLELCAENGITPILATIPTCSKNNELKNAYVRASGHRYIDFARAVGANGDGTWYTGLLSSDNLHPSEQGAKALFMRACADFPEIMMA